MGSVVGSVLFFGVILRPECTISILELFPPAHWPHWFCSPFSALAMCCNAVHVDSDGKRAADQLWLQDNCTVGHIICDLHQTNSVLFITPEVDDMTHRFQIIKKGNFHKRQFRYGPFYVSAHWEITGSALINAPPDLYHLYSPPGLSKFHQEPSPQTVSAGGDARFECQIEGVPTPVITWEKDKVAVPEETRWPLCVVVAPSSRLSSFSCNISMNEQYFSPHVSLISLCCALHHDIKVF